MAALPRRLEMILVDSLMASRGYAPTPRPYGAPPQLWYYADGRTTIAVTACQAGDVETRAYRIANRLGPSFLSGHVSVLLVFTPCPVRLNIAASPWARRVRIVPIPAGK